MTTPLIILALLFIPLIFSLAAGRRRDAAFRRLGGVTGLSLAFVFFGIGHFAMTDSMVQMLPPFIPHKELIIYATGVLEFALAAALLVPAARQAAGWTCIAVFLLFFPANVYAALNHTGPGGHMWGPDYLLIRAPLQAFLIAWTWWFAVRR